MSRRRKLCPETGVIRKKWSGKLPLALIFPNVYRLGMANLGMQLVYGLANRHADIVCERVFLPESPSACPLSVESSRPLADFPVIFCSLSFEADFVNLIAILLRGKVHPLASERGEQGEIAAGTPLVVGGGVATFINPEPLAPYMDMFLLGEAEPVLGQLLERLLTGFAEGFAERRDFLQKTALAVPGSYVPGFYEPVYEEKTLARVIPRQKMPYPVKKQVLESADRVGHSQLLTPEAEFADLFLAELGRGCSRGCRFCAAGFVYRPPRLWPAEAIVTALSGKPADKERVGLLGMEMARPGDLAKVASYLLEQSCQLSFSSLRADAIGPELLALLARSGLKTAAIAPDGGSERLRRVINKNLNEEEILWAARELVSAGVTNLKLYFMIGLPTEEPEDLDELVKLTLKVKEDIHAIGRKRGRLATLTVSLNCFVPKAWTPFQFCAFAGVAELKKKVKYLRREFRGQANFRLNADKPDNAFFQAVLARGDRRVGEMLLSLAGSGRNWRQLFREHGVEPEDYTRAREFGELFPWEVVDHGIKKEYLWAEYKRALAGKVTSACDTAICKRCGVCHGAESD